MARQTNATAALERYADLHAKAQKLRKDADRLAKQVQRMNERATEAAQLAEAAKAEALSAK